MPEQLPNPSPSLRQTVRPGDRPSAREQTTINRTVAGLVRSTIAAPFLGMLRIFRLAGQMGADDSSSSAGHKRNATLMGYNALQNDWEDTAISVGNITDPNDLVWDANQRVICFYDRQSGMYIPVNPTMVRHARTVADDDGNYPAAAALPNTYPIKFTSTTYTKAAGKQSQVVTFLDDTEGPDDFVLNVYDGAEPAYLAEGTDVWCYAIPVNGETSWFTFVCCDSDVESSSSSSQSRSGSDSSESQSSFSQSFSSSSFSSDSTDMGCQHCTSTPRFWRLEISGIANAGCSDCASLFNGTHLIEFAPNQCQNGNSLGFYCASTAAGAVSLTIGAGSIQVAAGYGTLTPPPACNSPFKPDQATFRLSIATPYDCEGISNLDIPLLDAGCPVTCDGSGASATLTGL